MDSTTLLALVCLAFVGELVLARQSSSHEWVKYKRQHGKVYDDQAEDARRFSLFLAAKERVERHNANEGSSYKLGLNHLSDWSSDEFLPTIGQSRGKLKHQKGSTNDALLRSILDDPSPVPDEFDWRKIPDRVSPVKDQGKCAASGAFVAVGVLEGQQVARNFTKSLVPLSVQQVLDCPGYFGPCSETNASVYLTAISDVGGVMSENDYKYVWPRESWCRFNRLKSVMSISGETELPALNGTILKKLVATFGPVASHISATDKFWHYKSGVFEDAKCGFGFPHYVLIVGYGHESKHGDFWILKNSMGSDWGERGYMRIERGKNMCAIELVAMIPTFD